MKHFSTIFIFLMFFIASTLSAQVNWTKYPVNPVLRPGPTGSWEDYTVYAPFVLKHGDTLKMWYTGSKSFDVDHIGYAISTDGINWQKETSNPVLYAGASGSWDAASAVHPYIIVDDTTYHMWYGGTNNPSATAFRIGYATSTDGINWTKYPGNPVMELGDPGEWDSATLAGHSYYFDGETFHMWYGGCDNLDYSGSCIGYATSPDGIHWEKYAGNPVFCGSSGWDSNYMYTPRVIVDTSGYKMWYSGSNSSIDRIGYATSADGIVWVPSEEFVLGDGGQGEWDDRGVYQPHVILYYDSTYYIWYAGHRSGTGSQIGYATAPLNINVPGDYATIQSAIDAVHDGNVVLVDEGTYYENINFKGKKITVASRYLVDQDTSHISRTIIDGSQHSNPDSGSVVYFVSGEDTNSVLCGFTITGGTGTKSFFNGDEMRTGGGISIWYSGAKIMHNHIMNNNINLVKANVYCHGAGLDIFGMPHQTILITENEIRNNTVNSWWGGGAGIVMGTAGKILFERNIVASNIYNSSNVTGGGGFYIWADNDYAGEIILNSNLIKNNESHGSSNNGYGYGGGVYIESCNPELTNNIITGNISGEGGGVNISTWPNGLKAKSILINNTITENKARRGGAIFIKNSEAIILNTIMWDNQATVNKPEIYNSGSTISVYYSDIAGGWEGEGEGNINTNPSFIDSLFNLSDTSFCVGNGKDSIEVAGNWYKCPSLDYYGNLRPHMGDELVDIGSIESPFLQVPLNISQKDLVIPNKFDLNQNYPNPFNPSTTIEFTLPKSEHTILKIFNILGKEVATLVSNKLNSGNHTYTFDGKNLASGVYYYQLVAGEYREVKKMILIK